MKTRCVTTARSRKKTNKKKLIEDPVSIALISDTPGYRMKSYGPAALLPITARYKLIDIQISCIKKVFTNAEIVLCIGFEAERITRYIKSKYKNLNIRIVENQLFSETNSCEALRLCLNNINNEKLFLMNGSLLFDHKTFKYGNMENSCIFIEDQNSQLDIGANVNEDVCVEYFSFGASKCWSEIIFLHNEEIIESLWNIVSSENYKKKFIFEALNELIKMNFDIKSINNKYSVKKISNIKTYHEIRNNK